MRKISTFSGLMTAIAFLAGTVGGASVASAAPRPGPPEIWIAIDGLQAEIDSFFDIFVTIETHEADIAAVNERIDSVGDVSALESRIAALEALEVLANTPPLVDAGPDFTMVAAPESLFGKSCTFTLTGTASDDGLANPSLLLTWYGGGLVYSGSTTATFKQPVSFTLSGADFVFVPTIVTYTFVADDGMFTGSDTVTVTCVP